MFFDEFIVMSIISSIVFFVIFIIIVVNIIKAIKKSEMWKETKENIKGIGSATKEYFSNNSFFQDENVVCEYCESVLPKGTTKCPYCSASIKRKKKKS